jgi:hypothetical protein
VQNSSSPASITISPKAGDSTSPGSQAGDPAEGVLVTVLVAGGVAVTCYIFYRRKRRPR